MSRFHLKFSELIDEAVYTLVTSIAYSVDDDKWIFMLSKQRKNFIFV